MAKKGLGRGFSSLIPTEMIVDEKIDSELGLEYDKSQLKELKISDISPDPEQPRRYFDKEKLEELASSIKIHGVLQPIVVIRKNKIFFIVGGGGPAPPLKARGARKGSCGCSRAF